MWDGDGGVAAGADAYGDGAALSDGYWGAVAGSDTYEKKSKVDEVDTVVIVCLVL